MMSLSSDIRRVLEIFNTTKDNPRPYREFEKVSLRTPERTFEREEGTSPQSPESPFGISGAIGEKRPNAAFVMPPLRSRKVFRPLEAPPAIAREPEEWKGIKAAVSDLVPSLPPSPDRWPVMMLSSLAGGSGRSTLTSVLAVENARRGRPSLLIDLNETSLYPYLFMIFHHEESIRIGRNWTFYTYEPTGVPIIVIRPEPEEFQEGKSEEGFLTGLRDEIVAQASTFLSQMECSNPMVLIDAPPMTRQSFQEASGLASILLSPIRPDLPSLLSVKDMEKTFERIEREESRYCERFYVLNRFVPDHPLHQDVYDVFRQILARRLCPFVIPEDPTVELSLAKGESLLDVFPETPAAVSMAECARWIAGKTPR